jgi:hypothetical protein
METFSSKFLSFLFLPCLILHSLISLNTICSVVLLYFLAMYIVFLNHSCFYRHFNMLNIQIIVLHNSLQYYMKIICKDHRVLTGIWFISRDQDLSFQVHLTHAHALPNQVASLVRWYKNGKVVPVLN